MRIRFALLLLLTACPAADKAKPSADAPPKDDAPPASQPASRPEPKTITVKYTDPTCGGAGPCVCVGELEVGMQLLRSIGVEDAALTTGTPCLLGDFDGNGHVDGAFLEPGLGDKPAVAVGVLMYDEGGVMVATKIPKKVTSLAILREEDRQALIEPEARMRFDFADGKFEPKRM
ncbi:MAG: hypothetical protein RIT81_47285 [Deltaproteobacteria bacterium]